jgi:hypothetical protein
MSSCVYLAVYICVCVAARIYTFGIKHVSTSMLFVCACECAAISMCLSVLLNVCNALRIYYVA